VAIALAGGSRFAWLAARCWCDLRFAQGCEWRFARFVSGAPRSVDRTAARERGSHLRAKPGSQRRAQRGSHLRRESVFIERRCAPAREAGVAPPRVSADRTFGRRPDRTAARSAARTIGASLCSSSADAHLRAKRASHRRA
jgi:hypothetical protein